MHLFNIIILSAAYLHWAQKLLTGVEQDWKKLAKAAYKNVGFPAMFADPIKSIRGIESVENTFWKKSPGNLDDVEQQQWQRSKTH